MSNKKKLDLTSIIALLIGLVCSYISLVNLDSAAFWHDEGNLAMTAHNIVKTGGFNGWDGRNLFAGEEGKALDPNLNIITYPPWRALPSVLGIYIFGFNEYGVRFFHTILGLLSVVVFWFIVKQEYPNNRRLWLIALTCYALSTQVILFFRYGRYCADAMFFTLLMFYSYRMYMLTTKFKYLAILTITTILSLLNHYFITATLGTTFALYHCVYYWRNTTKTQWWQLACAGTIATTLSVSVVIQMGVFKYLTHLETGNLDYQHPYLERVFLGIKWTLHDIVPAGQIPFWFAVLLLLLTLNRCVLLFQSSKFAIPLTISRGQKLYDYSKKIDASLPRINHIFFIIIVYYVTYQFFNILRVTRFPFIDIRNFVPTLPFLAILLAALIEWIYTRVNKFAGIAVLVILISSNLLSKPFELPHYLTDESKIEWRLPALVGEVHRDYDGYIRETFRFLEEHAEQDDMIYVTKWQDRPAYLFYLGNKLIFCCMLEPDHLLSKEKLQALGDYFIIDQGNPKWVIVGSNEDEIIEKLIAEGYKPVFASITFNYPTQRPGLAWHKFKPLELQPKEVVMHRAD